MTVAQLYEIDDRDDLIIDEMVYYQFNIALYLLFCVSVRVAFLLLSVQLLVSGEEKIPNGMMN